LKDGEARDLKVGPNDADTILVAKFNGKMYAVGNTCPHLGAPLSSGLFFGDKIICPWHGAAFNVVSGAH
jgi:nitrite reductase/ring-hydroxylating ferredoxin subunit